MKKTSRRLSLLLAAACALQACGKIDDGGAITSGTPVTSTTTTTTTSPTASTSAGLFFHVTSSWEGSSTRTTWLSNCTIPLSSATGTSINCTMSVPEAELHYSSLYMKVGSSDTSKCALVLFYPYVYQASSAASYTLPRYGAATTAVCNASPLPLNCYDGPATLLHPTYPYITHTYMVTENTPEAEFTITSGWTNNRLTNTWVANAITNAAAGDSVTAPGSTRAATYVANTMQDYQAKCIDEYNETIYTITVKITSVPYPSAGTISYPGWN